MLSKERDIIHLEKENNVSKNVKKHEILVEEEIINEISDYGEESVNSEYSENTVNSNVSDGSDTSDDIENIYYNNFLFNYTKNFLFSNTINILFFFLAIYTDIQLFFKNTFYKEKIVNIDEIEFLKNDNSYSYFKNNKVIATSQKLTNRKNYDFALYIHNTNVGYNYYEIYLPYNKVKRRNLCISDKHFMSIYFTINENDYEIKLDDDNMNLYLTNNIIDYNIINFIMFEKYNISISNVPYNLVIIDSNSQVILLKETQFIKLHKNRYIVGKYD
tara:strand:- start:25620 stop:26441 length:822 start_codon:yes stop_codon:yes gene_type:complete